jgi:hypothetical protein
MSVSWDGVPLLLKLPETWLKDQDMACPVAFHPPAKDPSNMHHSIGRRLLPATCQQERNHIKLGSDDGSLASYTPVGSFSVVSGKAYSFCRSLVRRTDTHRVAFNTQTGRLKRNETKACYNVSPLAYPGTRNTRKGGDNSRSECWPRRHS